MPLIKARLLWLGVEPTPYILALQSHARETLPFETDFAFVRRNASQDWGLPEMGYALLTDAGAKVQALLRVLRRDYQGVFLEAWGTGFLASAGLAALASAVPLVVSGDTWCETAARGFPRLGRTVRRLLLRRASATLPGGSRQGGFFMSEGAHPDRMVVRQMTVDVVALARRAAELTPRRGELRAALGLPCAAVVAVAVARLVPEKGIDLLLQALCEVPDLYVLVVGDGPQRAELEALGTRSGCSRRVKWAGRLSHEDVVSAFVAADFLVLPSRFEPWGLVVNEAMACGLPVVVSSAAGCVDDLVAGKGSGTVVQAGDARSLARALAELAGDAETRARAATSARELIARWTLAEETSAIRRALDLAVRL